MTATKQEKPSDNSLQSIEQKQQMLLFYKSYMKYIKKLLQNSGTQTSQNTIFNLKKISNNISLELFLQRVFSYFKCGPEAFICSLCFIDRLLNSQSAKTEKITLSIKNVFKIISVALLISTKNFNDFYYNNTYYSRVCGLTLQELNFLEKQFLKMIDFDVFIDGEEYSSYDSVIQGYKNAYVQQMNQFIQIENLRQMKTQVSFQERTNCKGSQQKNEANIQVEIVA